MYILYSYVYLYKNEHTLILYIHIYTVSLYILYSYVYLYINEHTFMLYILIYISFIHK